MTRGFAHTQRFGHPAAALKHHLGLSRREPSSSCFTGGFYKTPTAGEILNSDDPVTLTWDTTCLDTTKADLYLLAPNTPTTPRIKLWKNIDFTTGTFTEVLKPKWWNSTETESLQFALVLPGDQPFNTDLPAAPYFNMTYTANDSNAENADTLSLDPTIVDVSQGASEETSVQSGKIAASVLIPIFILALIGITAYIKVKRIKTTEKSKQFTEKIDKRMSTISNDWKSISVAGATAAVRHSMAVSNNEDDAGARTSSFSGHRPASTFNNAAPHIRPGLRSAQLAERVSRISFAEGTRPSGEYRRNAASRAFHDDYIPPVPTRQEPPRQDSDLGLMSPTQSQGPLPLSNDEIQARVSDPNDVMPALSMMRMGGSDASVGNDFILPASPPPIVSAPPTPTLSKTSSSHSPLGPMPMSNTPTAYNSPDDMLRAYAERRATGSQVINYPAPAANVDANGMRVLYSPTTPGSATTPHSANPLFPK